MSMMPNTSAVIAPNRPFPMRLERVSAIQPTITLINPKTAGNSAAARPEVMPVTCKNISSRIKNCIFILICFRYLQTLILYYTDTIGVSHTFFVLAKLKWLKHFGLEDYDIAKFFLQ
jgi:hypothetical protein